MFLDANIFHFYLRGPSEIQKTCILFLERIVKGEISGFTSSLVLDEVMYKILLKTIEDKHRKNPIEAIQSSREEVGVQSKVVRKALDIILGIENLEVLSVKKDYLEVSVEYMEKFSMLPRDAIHLAVMKSVECSDIVSADSDFDKVPSVTRWTPLLK